MDTLELVQKLEDGEMDGWYFHASRRLLDINRRYVVEMVPAEDYERTGFYGDVFNFFLPVNAVDVDEISANVATELMKQYEDYLLTPTLENTLRNFESAEQVAEEMNPTNIVDSAGLWDDPEFVNWFFDQYPDYYFVKTEDGAVTMLNLFEGDLLDVEKDTFEEALEEL